MSKKKPIQPAPKPTKRFILVIKAVVEMTIEAKTAAGAVAEWNRRFKRHPRFGRPGRVVQMFGDKPAVLDTASGEVSTTNTQRRRTVKEAWNCPPPEKLPPPMVMTRYFDEKRAIVAVTLGLADKWICARGRRRVKSPALPPRQTAEECQADLDAYAAKRGWKLYEGE